MVCQSCGKSLVRGYSFCMECGAPVPPEALEEAGMPPRTGDHAETPKKTAPDNAEGGMPGISPMMSDDDSGNSDGKTLAYCKNCGTVMQSNPYTCEKCGEPLAGSQGGIPLFRNPDSFSEGLEDVGEDMDLSEMLGMDGSPEDEMDDAAAKMFGNLTSPAATPAQPVNQFSEADLEALNMQMSRYSEASLSAMPVVGRDIPSPEPKSAQPQPVDKDAPMIAETEFIPESGGFIEETPPKPSYAPPKQVEFTEPAAPPAYQPPAPPKPVYAPPKQVEFTEPPAPKPVELTKPAPSAPPRPVPPRAEAPVIAPPANNAPRATVTPQTNITPGTSATPVENAPIINSIDDRDYHPEDDEIPSDKRVPKFLYFGVIVILVCITLVIILSNVK